MKFISTINLPPCLIVIFLTLIPSISLMGQSHLTMTLENASSTSNTLEFDVYIVNDGTTTLDLGGYQFGVNFSTTILNGAVPGSTSFIYIPGTRNPMFNPLSINSTTYSNSQLKLTCVPSIYVNIPAGISFRLGRFRFTTPASWLPASTPNLSFQLLPAAGKTSCLAYCYVNSAPPGISFTNGSSNLNAIVNSNNIILNNTCLGGNTTDGSATVTSCNTYTWNGNTYTTSGIYTYTSLNTQGCVNTATLNLTINQNSTNGNATITACNSYTWNGTTYTTTGIYTYTSINTQGCVNTATLNLTINQNSTNGNATITACNSYTWNGNTYTTSGIYTYTSLNTQGCVNTATLNLTINVSAIAANVSPDLTVCVGTPIILSGSGGITYSWSNGGGNPVNGIAFIPTASSIYTVTGTDANNCTNTSSISIVVFNSPPTTASSSRCGSGIVNLSASGSGTLTWYNSPTGGTALATGTTYDPNISATATYYVENYFYSNSSGNISNVGPTNNTIGAASASGSAAWLLFDVIQPCTLQSVIVYPYAAGTVTLVQRDSTGTIILNSTTISVSTSQILTPVTMTLNWPLTVGNGYRLYRQSSSVLLSRNSSGALYPYSNPYVNITGSSVNSSTYLWAYKWTLIENTFCTSTRTPVVATINSLPIADAGVDKNLNCTVTSTIIGTTAIAGNLYQWSPSTGLSSSSIAQPIANPSNTTNYTLTVTGSNGCIATDDVSVSVNTTNSDTVSACSSYTWPINGTTYTSSGTYTMTLGCHTEILSLTIYTNTTNGNAIINACDSYTWNGTNYTVSGNFTYTSLNAQGCINTDSLTLTINPKPTASIGSNTTICQNSTSPVINITGANGTPPYTFIYSINNGINQSISSIGNYVSVSAPTNNPGTFIFKLISVSDLNCSQLQSDSAIIIIQPQPNVSSTNVDGCAGIPVNLIGSPAGGVFNLANPYTGPSTSYNYTFTDTNGCTSTSQNSIINIHPLPTVTVSGGGLVCSGYPLPNLNLTLTGTPPWTITYTNGLSNSTLSGLTASSFSYPAPSVGNYSVVNISDANCIGTSTGSASVSVITGGGSTQINDVGVSALLTPISDCGLTNNETVTIKINNYGNTCQSNFTVGYQVNGGSIVTENINALSIVPGSFGNYSFVTKVNLFAIGNYTIKVFTALTTDSIKTNDTITSIINHFPLLTPPGNLLPLNDTTKLNYPINFSWSYIPNATTYDLYIWKFTDTMPSIPIVSNITSINYAYATQNLLYGTKYKWKIVAKVNLCNTSSAIQTFTMRFLADLQVQQILVPATGVSESSIAISWKIRNNGPGKTNTSWYDQVYFSESPQLGITTDYYVGTYGNVSALDSGQFYQTPIHIFTIPQGVQGDFYVIVSTDAYNNVKEISDANNLSASDTMLISIAPNADLQVTNVVVAPTTIFSNDSLTISWKVKNLGNGPTPSSSWQDAIYMDTNAIFNLNNTVLMSLVNHSGNMSIVDSYAVTRRIKIPLAAESTRYIHIFTDRFNQLYEYAYENNNVTTSIPIDVIQSPTPDLKITTINVPYDTMSNGQTFSAYWTVKNDGATTALPNWQDYIFFNTDSFSTGITTSLGNRINIFSIASLGTESYSYPLSVPQNLTEGNQFVFIKTDNSNTVFEGIFENNNTLRNTLPIYIANADITPTQLQAPAAAESEQSITVSWAGKNNGKGTIINNPWKDGIYLSTDTLLNTGDVLLNSILNNYLFLPNNQYTRQFNVTLPTAVSGNFYLLLKNDYENNIVESNENDNVKYTPITISLAPWADLQVTTFQTSTVDTAGTPLNFEAHIKNLGSGKIVNKNWTDRVYISPSNNFNNSSKILLLSVNQQLSLDTGQTYIQNNSVNLPYSLSTGTYYLYYVADGGNTIFENTDENNNVLMSLPITIFSQNTDLAAISAVVDTNAILAGQTMAITWTGKNNGIDDATTNWYDAVYLSNNTTIDGGDILLGSWIHNSILKKDSTYTSTKNITIPISASGIYYLLLKVDNTHQLNDTILTNNSLVLQSGSSVTTVSVTQPLPSDLIPTNFSAPAQSLESQPIFISYQINNNGIGPTGGSSWTDNIYISTDNILNAEDIQIGSFTHIGIVNSAGMYLDTQSVTIPVGLAGNYFLLCKADGNDMIYEHLNENNNITFTSIYIISQQPSDLIVKHITTPLDSVITGENITVNWKIYNQGFNVANGYFRDGIYLSIDSTLDLNDQLLGINDGNVTIVPSDSLSRQMTMPLNNVPSGNYYLIGKTDLLNNIIESNDANNVGITESTIQVDVKKLFMNVLKQDTIVNNRQLYYKINIPASLQGETMKLTLKGDTAHNAINKLFLSYATTPSANVYDFSSQIAFTANQEILVPQLQIGTYYIMAFGNDTATVNQQISLLAKIIPFSITSVNANQGGNTGGVTIQINGAKFATSTQFGLIDSANNFFSPYSNFFVNETKVFAGFNLQNAATGFYDVVAINAQGDTVKLIDGFQVIQGPGGISGTGGNGGAGTGTGFVCQIVNIGFEDLLQTTPFYPASTRPNRVVSITVYYENNGTVDIPIPIRYMISLGGAPISFLPTDFLANKKDLTLEFKEDGGPPTVLRAGANGFIKVYSKATAPLEFIIAE